MDTQPLNLELTLYLKYHIELKKDTPVLDLFAIATEFGYYRGAPRLIRRPRQSTYEDLRILEPLAFASIGLTCLD